MNFFKESARIFQHYYEKPAHKLGEKEDKMLADMNSLLQAVYDLGYADGSEGAFVRAQQTLKHFEKEESFQSRMRRTEVLNFFDKTPHIKREQ